MQQTIIKNKEFYLDILSKIKNDWLQKLYILTDFDWTLTKTFSWWKSRPSIISVLRSEWYLWEEYSRKAYELFDYYHPIEINNNISIEEKKKEMTNWWNKHFDLLINSKLNKKDIEKVVNSWIIEFKDWIKEFLYFLNKNNIPLIIVSASWLGVFSIKLYFEQQWVFTDNIKIISNEFYWDLNWNAYWYNKKIIHTFNKDEIILLEFPEIFNILKDKTNIIMLWDSIWDLTMLNWFNYKNLLKIWFLNKKDDEFLWKYTEHYDVILTWDSDANFLNKLLK